MSIMGRIVAVLALLCVAPTAQFSVVGVAHAQVAKPGVSPGFRSGFKYLNPYDSNATTYFAAMSVQPDNTRKNLINNLVLCMKAGNAWSQPDAIYLLASHDAQAARINLKNPAQIATTSVTPPTFTTDRGYTGIPASSAYLETGIADNAATNWAASSSAGTIFAYINQAPTASGTVIGLASTSNTQGRLFAAAGSVSGRVHGLVNLAASSPANALGFSAIVRTASNALTMYRGSTAATTSASANTPVVGSDTFQMLGSASYSDARVAIAGFGGPWDATQEASANTCFATYLTAIGGN